jgi:hypothetical protein
MTTKKSGGPPVRGTAATSKTYPHQEVGRRREGSAARRQSVDGTDPAYAAEEWRPVVGFEDSYAVSDRGRVRSVDRLVEVLSGPRAGEVRLQRGRLLRQFPAKGRHQVTLCLAGVRSLVGVHQLVAAAFLGPRPPGQVVRHLDDVHAHNWVGNLAYGTHADNSQDALRNGRHPKAASMCCKRQHVLGGRNLRRPRKSPQQRYCVACGRASASVYRTGGTEADLRHLADRKYLDLMAGDWPGAEYTDALIEVAS